MVLKFKTTPGYVPVYDITLENVEELLGRRQPWFQPGQHRGEDRHFAVCPYCDTPIQLKGVYRRKSESPRPYGSHVGAPVPGFAFDQSDVEFCPYTLKASIHDASARRPPGPLARRLIDVAVTQFDRIVLILRADFGFNFSDAFAARMLEQWFDSRGYLYVGAHLRNLPWMIAYFGPAQSLFSQFIGGDLAKEIKRRVPHAGFSGEGQLQKGSAFFRLDLQCLRHRIAIGAEDGDPIESMDLRVQDFSKTNDPAKAPTILRKTIIFAPERFEALVHMPPERARRNQRLLAIARTIADKWGSK